MAIKMPGIIKKSKTVARLRAKAQKLKTAIKEEKKRTKRLKRRYTRTPSDWNREVGREFKRFPGKYANIGQAAAYLSYQNKVNRETPAPIRHGRELEPGLFSFSKSAIARHERGLNVRSYEY